MYYIHLMKDAQHKIFWKKSFANELGRLVQGTNKRVNGTYTICFIDYENIPSERRKYITYGNILVDYCPQKDEPIRTQLTVQGNLIDYSGNVRIHTADTTKANIVCNGIFYMTKSKYICIDNKNIYLGTSLTRYEYLYISITLITDEIIHQYNLLPIIINGFIYLYIHKVMYRFT